jgi:hypothetical protein
VVARSPILGTTCDQIPNHKHQSSNKSQISSTKAQTNPKSQAPKLKQIPNPKHQITNKSQIPIIKSQTNLNGQLSNGASPSGTPMPIVVVRPPSAPFGHLDLVIGHCL